ncbi:MAG: tRNA (5-methylaminomethyl-2-thiouridine)(34)-methyltransferase MnmD [Bacteroidetes bacterium]|nr:tRNA (5-methylaminomethyl-2-thiouridine)(34)-methyltransferase MnmD [Bacteroidota bacterium]
MKREFRVTKDGSPTFYIPELDEHFHSTHGAVQEAKHVFIQNGLNYLNNKIEINILEIGFGCGLNALLTCLEMESKNSLSVNYLGIESTPLSEDEYLKLDFSKQINADNYFSLYKGITDANWNETTHITPNFKILKIKSKIQDFDLSRHTFDLIYYDAFGPRAQQEMWEKSVFLPLYDALNTNGILVTYCAQGQFKRNLKEIGFFVEAKPGPPGKREMTIARKF